MVCSWINFRIPVQDEAREILKNAPGVVVIDERPSNCFPTPLEVSNKDDVAVGRIRRDVSQDGNYGWDWCMNFVLLNPYFCFSHLHDMHKPWAGWTSLCAVIKYARGLHSMPSRLLRCCYSWHLVVAQEFCFMDFCMWGRRSDYEP